MLTTMKAHSGGVIRRSFLVLVAGALMLSALAYGQSVQNAAEKAPSAANKDSIADEMEKARQDTPESIYYVERIAEAKAKEAVPMLEQKFVRTQDALDKAHVASALMRLGDRKDIYWDCLVKQAAKAVESDAPNFMSFDSQGKAVPGPSPEFQAWAKAHNLPTAGLLEEHMYGLPMAVELLGMTGDPRAVPLLRQALLSPNYQIETFAAMGLAQIGDKGSMPFIIQACKRAPAEAATVIASRSLVYFDDPEAQSAVDEYVPKDRAKILREDTAQRNRPWSF